MKGLQEITKGITRGIQKESPAILSGLAIGGLILTAWWTHRAALKAQDIVLEAVDNKEVDADLDWKKKVELTWKVYIPPVIMGATSIACIIGAHNISVGRQAALASIASISTEALKEYKDKVVETIGEKKEQKIRDEIAKDKIERNPPSGSTVILTDRGNTLMYDSLSGRYFRGDIEKIRRSENTLNKLMLSEDAITLNELYYSWGLPPIKTGDDQGWHIENGMIEFSFSSQLAENDEPCLVIDQRVLPGARF